jgi:hypothetical protein
MAMLAFSTSRIVKPNCSRKSRRVCPAETIESSLA